MIFDDQDDLGQPSFSVGSSEELFHSLDTCESEHLGTLMLQGRKKQLGSAAHAARSLCARQQNVDADLLVLAVENHAAVRFLSAPIEKQSS